MSLSELVCTAHLPGLGFATSTLNWPAFACVDYVIKSHIRREKKGNYRRLFEEGVVVFPWFVVEIEVNCSNCSNEARNRYPRPAPALHVQPSLLPHELVLGHQKFCQINKINIVQNQ
jgi:hypothetical protein